MFYRDKPLLPVLETACTTVLVEKGSKQLTLVNKKVLNLVHSNNMAQLSARL